MAAYGVFYNIMPSKDTLIQILYKSVEIIICKLLLAGKGKIGTGEWLISKVTNQASFVFGGKSKEAVPKTMRYY